MRFKIPILFLAGLTIAHFNHENCGGSEIAAGLLMTATFVFLASREKASD